MSTKINAYAKPLEIRFKGLYDYDNLLPTIRSYFEEHEFDTLRDTGFKYKAGSGPAGTEVDIKIEGVRFVSHYIKITLKIKGHAWNVNRKEQDYHGQKKKVTGGKIQLYVECTAELDYANMFAPKNPSKQKKAMLDWMKNILDDQYTGLQAGENYVTGQVFIRSLASDLQRRVKQYLNMECY
ncbi:MAG: hypothetical protein ACOCQQ_01875 [Candidatus Nanoarchaeia archaeon]